MERHTEAARHGVSGLQGAATEPQRERLRGLSPRESLSCRSRRSPGPARQPREPRRPHPVPIRRRARSLTPAPEPLLLSPPSLSGAREPHQQPLQASAAASQALQDAANLMPVSSLHCLLTRHCAAREGRPAARPRSGVSARMRSHLLSLQAPLCPLAQTRQLSPARHLSACPQRAAARPQWD